MNRDEFRDELHEALREALKEVMGGKCSCCSTCELSPQEHRDHHQAIRAAFRGRNIALGAVVAAAAVGILGFFVAAIWSHIKSLIP